MKKMLLFILAASLMLGCLGGEEAPSTPSANITLPGIGDTTPSGPSCDSPSYSFSKLEDGTFGQETDLVATVTCAAGEKLVVSVDGVEVDSQTVTTNATTPLSFKAVGIKDGTPKLTVTSGSDTLLSKDWDVEPLGDDDTSGLGYDAVSFKEYRAMAVDVESTVEAGQIRIFMKRMQFRTMPDSEIIVEVREDDGGQPGSIVGSSTKPITATTLSENWIKFDFDPELTLDEGRYWMTVRVNQTEDTTTLSDAVNIHYRTVDSQAEGNDYTAEMRLSVDEKTGVATETAWKELSYDRVYTMVIGSG